MYAFKAFIAPAYVPKIDERENSILTETDLKCWQHLWRRAKSQLSCVYSQQIIAFSALLRVFANPLQSLVKLLRSTK